jgi:hypothetical protein
MATDRVKWSLAIGLLSTDMIQAYVPDLGLRLTVETGLLRFVRECIEIYRQNEKLDNEITFVNAIMKIVEVHCGSDGLAELVYWVENLFQYDITSIANDVYVLRVLLDNSLVKDFQRPPFITRLKHEILATNREEIGLLRPSSEWDEEYYRRHGFPSTFDPIDVLVSTHRFFRTCTALLDVIGSQSIEANDREMVESWFQNSARSLEMPNRLVPDVIDVVSKIRAFWKS